MTTMMRRIVKKRKRLEVQPGQPGDKTNTQLDSSKRENRTLSRQRPQTHLELVATLTEQKEKVPQLILLRSLQRSKEQFDLEAPKEQEKHSENWDIQAGIKPAMIEKRGNRNGSL
jgi:hypothetical protein